MYYSNHALGWGGTILSGSVFGFNTKAGQRLAVATVGLDFKVEHLGEKGDTWPVTELVRACDLILPESKRGRYLIHFAKEEEGSGEPVQVLIGIR